jgi:phosphatidylserine/phosphatidylglycerophosphate/cardiolipin synthase-like enzyme
MSHALIVLPDDTSKPLVDAISGARRSLRIRMFLFTDATLLDAVVAAKKRGVDVRVMLNPARRSGKAENEVARKTLSDAAIAVIDSNPAFDLTHQKSMIVDDELGFVESLNWETRDLTETRDYAIVTAFRDEVNEMIAGFEADWNRQPFKPDAESNLIWCPDNGRERIARFIDEAKESLFVQNERYQDTVIIERLVRAARRGVKIHVLARPPHTLKVDKLIEGVGGLRIMNDVGVKVHTLRGLKLHAKTLLADGKRAIVGSINLAPGSFDARRELAIETEEKKVVKRLLKTMQHDWKHSRPLDLTDEGLVMDIEKRMEGGSAKLVLNAKLPKKKAKKSAKKKKDAKAGGAADAKTGKTKVKAKTDAKPKDKAKGKTVTKAKPKTKTKTGDQAKAVAKKAKVKSGKKK